MTDDVKGHLDLGEGTCLETPNQWRKPYNKPSKGKRVTTLHVSVTGVSMSIEE